MLEILIDGNNSLSVEHKEEIQVIFRKSLDLLISSILIIIIDLEKGDL